MVSETMDAIGSETMNIHGFGNPEYSWFRVVAIAFANSDVQIVGSIVPKTT